MNDRRADVPPFPPSYRASGVLLHVTSLPCAYGIGDLGPSAFAWVDRLHEAGQRWWQGLPVGPRGYCESPYQRLSSFAGNELLIRPDGLIDDGLLRAADCAHDAFSPSTVEYERVVPFKVRLLETAWSRFSDGARPDLRPAYEEFCRAHGFWLDDSALFRGLKARYNGACYLEWPVELARRIPVALAQARRELGNQVELVRFAQFLLARQADRLERHAHDRGVRLIGDLPFFVSPDSSDVWANPELLLLGENRHPTEVAGVPPDYFSANGQLWGNPVYDWDALRQSGYRWCVDRLRALLTQVDLIRLDHSRAFAAAWHVPSGASTARAGRWVRGPGAEFFEAAEKGLGTLPFIAEDLGHITPDVTALRDRFHLPGMRVLQFAFDGSEENPHLPQNYVENSHGLRLADRVPDQPLLVQPSEGVPLLALPGALQCRGSGNLETRQVRQRQHGVVDAAGLVPPGGSSTARIDALVPSRSRRSAGGDSDTVAGQRLDGGATAGHRRVDGHVMANLRQLGMRESDRSSPRLEVAQE